MRLQRLVDDEDQLIECDVANDESIEQAFATIKERFTKVDGIVHAIAFAKKRLLATPITTIFFPVNIFPILSSLKLSITFFSIC